MRVSRRAAARVPGTTRKPKTAGVSPRCPGSRTDSISIDVAEDIVAVGALPVLTFPTRLAPGDPLHGISCVLPGEVPKDAVFASSPVESCRPARHLGKRRQSSATATWASRSWIVR